MGYKVTEAKYQTCLCGKVCKGLSALQTHGRACPKEQVRRAAYIATIERGTKPLSDSQVLVNYDFLVSGLIKLGYLPADFNADRKVAK